MTAPLAEPPTEDHRTQQQDRNLVRTGREHKRLLGVQALPGEFRDQIAEAVRIVANVRTLWRNRATDILGRLPAVRSLDLSASSLTLALRTERPLDWATTQNNLGNALPTLGERESGTARLEEAVAAFRDALREQTRERVPLDWAVTQNNLGAALRMLSERESGMAWLEEAVVAYREALKEWTRERVPLQWAGTQNNLGAALRMLSERESGTARLEEAVAAFRDALKEQTRERVPLQWAVSFGNEGVALMLLAERRGDFAMAETALSQLNTAFETMRDGGHAPNAAFYEQQLPRARALVARLREQ
jgi:tetratricopeptide (TPR) repeat protein